MCPFSIGWADFYLKKLQSNQNAKPHIGSRYTQEKG